MPGQSWMETLLSSTGDGVAGTGTTENSIAPVNTKVALGPIFNFPGSKFRLIAAGRISNIVTTPGTLTFRTKLGPTANIAVASSPAFQLNAVAKTNVSWWLEWLFDVRTNGSGTSATIMHEGQWTSESVVGSPLPSAGGAGTLMIPASAPAVGTGFDSTIANLFDLTSQFSLTGNSIQVHQLLFQSLTV